MPGDWLMIENRAPIACFFGYVWQHPNAWNFGLSYHRHWPHTLPSHFQMRKQRSRKNLFKDAQLWGRGSTLGLKSRARVAGSSTSLNDKPLFKSGANGNTVDLGTLWSPGSALHGIAMFGLRGKQQHQAGEGCQNMLLFTSDYVRCNPHSNVAECLPGAGWYRWFCQRRREILGTAWQRRGCSAHQFAELLLLRRQQEQHSLRWACGDCCLHNQPESPSPWGSVAGGCLASQKSLWFASASSGKCLKMKDICRPTPAICRVVQWTGPNCRALGRGTDANGSFSKGERLPTLANETRLNKHGDKLEAGLPNSHFASFLKSGLWMLSRFCLNIFVRWHGFYEAEDAGAFARGD